MRTRFAPLLAALLLAAGCDDGDVKGMTFTVTERLTGAGPLGTCSFETHNDPLLQPDAQALAWSVGSVVGVVGDFTQACGGAFGGQCQPVTDYEWVLVGKPNFEFQIVPTSELNGLSGEVAGLLTALAPGTGGIGVHYRSDTFGPITMQAFAPDLLKVTTFGTWDGGKQAPQESVLPATVKAGTSMNVILRAFDSAGGRLCGRGPADSTGTTGITLAADTTLGAKDIQANSVIVLTFGAAGTATLKLAFGGANLSQDFDVRP